MSGTFHMETIATLHSSEVSHKFKGYQIFKEQPNFFNHQKREQIFFTLVVFSTKYAKSKSSAFQYELKKGGVLAYCFEVTTKVGFFFN